MKIRHQELSENGCVVVILLITRKTSTPYQMRLILVEDEKPGFAFGVLCID